MADWIDKRQLQDRIRARTAELAADHWHPALLRVTGELEAVPIQPPAAKPTVDELLNPPAADDAQLATLRRLMAATSSPSRAIWGSSARPALLAAGLIETIWEGEPALCIGDRVTEKGRGYVDDRNQ